MVFAKVKQLHNQVFNVTNYIHSPIIAFVRIYMAWIFLKSGLTKIKDWESTLLLFEYEYQVPFLSIELAAWMGTAGELILPVLLIVGLFTRLSAIGLFIVNFVAVISLSDIAPAALSQHLLWGCLLLFILLLGAGKVSLDNKFKIS